MCIVTRAIYDLIVCIAIESNFNLLGIQRERYPVPPAVILITDYALLLPVPLGCRSLYKILFTWRTSTVARFIKRSVQLFLHSDDSLHDYLY